MNYQDIETLLSAVTKSEEQHNLIEDRLLCTAAKFYISAARNEDVALLHSYDQHIVRAIATLLGTRTTDSVINSDTANALSEYILNERHESPDIEFAAMNFILENSSVLDRFHYYRETYWRAQNTPGRIPLPDYLSERQLFGALVNGIETDEFPQLTDQAMDSELARNNIVQLFRHAALRVKNGTEELDVADLSASEVVLFEWIVDSRLFEFHEPAIARLGCDTRVANDGILALCKEHTLTTFSNEILDQNKHLLLKIQLCTHVSELSDIATGLEINKIEQPKTTHTDQITTILPEFRLLILRNALALETASKASDLIDLTSIKSDNDLQITLASAYALFKQPRGGGPSRVFQVASDSRLTGYHAAALRLCKAVRESKQRLAVTQHPFYEHFTIMPPRSLLVFLTEHGASFSRLELAAALCGILRNLAIDECWNRHTSTLLLECTARLAALDLELFQGYLAKAPTVINNIKRKWIFTHNSTDSSFLKELNERIGAYNNELLKRVAHYSSENAGTAELQPNALPELTPSRL